MLDLGALRWDKCVIPPHVEFPLKAASIKPLGKIHGVGGYSISYILEEYCRSCHKQIASHMTGRQDSVKIIL